ncbi:unnamed protein product [Adineta steineri]|uniref:Uncharacterized protein n=1 Tax=Adineta steineri TaxID=433720 RepID=A0A813SLI9_9BILA|nr:unnamed protein product [Adineta steineri]CAF0796813.1 unnamed protein product [Adineta steineri]
MNEISKMNETIYRFRFGITEKTIQITQQQLNHFPYLFAFVNHRDDFSVNKNDNGEYILDNPICYDWFKSIFQSVIKEQPSALFTELTHEADVLCMLELYDYLCIEPLPLPLLKNQQLVLTNLIDIDDVNKHIQWRPANIREARNIAAQFIISISKNAYNLNDLNTINSIFTLLMDIFSHPNIFHSRFRYHTLKIIKKECFSLFSHSQQRQLPTNEQIIQNIKIHFVRYLNNENQYLTPNFYNAFAWKDIYVSSAKFNCYLDFSPFKTLDRSDFVLKLRCLSDDLEPRCNDTSFDDFVMSLYNLQKEQEQEQERKKKEAQSARSGRFNTLPKRPKVDKFKHRSGPKAQKYR